MIKFIPVRTEVSFVGSLLILFDPSVNRYEIHITLQHYCISVKLYLLCSPWILFSYIHSQLEKKKTWMLRTWLVFCWISNQINTIPNTGSVVFFQQGYLLFGCFCSLLNKCHYCNTFAGLMQFVKLTFMHQS